MQDCIQARINWIRWVNLKPEEKVVLIVAPNNFYYNAAKSNLRNDNAVPDAIKEHKTIFFVDSTTLWKKIVLAKEKYLLCLL